MCSIIVSVGLYEEEDPHATHTNNTHIISGYIMGELVFIIK